MPKGAIFRCGFSKIIVVFIPRILSVEPRKMGKQKNCRDDGENGQDADKQLRLRADGFQGNEYRLNEYGKGIVYDVHCYGDGNGVRRIEDHAQEDAKEESLGNFLKIKSEQSKE